eukprot:TRINITY_DN7689_c0_g1_i1.p1 TRINITY_DN7689_c0_g1~~TRINITY_DN7689_c0_g1_i1.p1  ORF type:complete len:574 (+),score=84.70 TRINITY_DN7689_c0_g1_i1:66-1787(+)
MGSVSENHSTESSLGFESSLGSERRRTKDTAEYQSVDTSVNLSVDVPSSSRALLRPQIFPLDSRSNSSTTRPQFTSDSSPFFTVVSSYVLNRDLSRNLSHDLSTDESIDESTDESIDLGMNRRPSAHHHHGPPTIKHSTLLDGDLSIDGSLRYASLNTGVVNLLKATIGLGFLSLPYCFKKLGFLFGAYLIIIMGSATKYSMYLLHKCSTRSQKLTYSQIALEISGVRLCLIVNIILILLSIGEMGASFLIAKSIIQDFLNLVDEERILEKKLDNKAELVFLLIFAIIMLALCTVSSFNKLKYSSAVGLGCIGVIMSLSVVEFLIANFSMSRKFTMPADDYGVISALPILIFSFQFTCQFMPIYAEFKQPCWDAHARQLTEIPIMISTVFYIAFATLGYLRFGGDLQENIFGNYAAIYTDSPYRTILAFTQFLFLVALGSSFPLYFRPLLQPIQDLMQLLSLHRPEMFERLLESETRGEQVRDIHRRYSFKVAFFTLVVAFSLAASTDDIFKVIAFLGSLVSAPITFVIPAYMYIQTMPNVRFREKVSPFLLFFFGLFICVCCTSLLIIDAVL